MARPEAVQLIVGQRIDFYDHRWNVVGIHLGALKQESLIELEQVYPGPGWTGPWEYHPKVFVPEILLSAALQPKDSNNA